MKITCRLARLACAVAILLVGGIAAASAAPPASVFLATPEWNVVVVGSSQDTLWVDVSLPGAGATDDCIPNSCSTWEEIRCLLTPCPLGRSPIDCSSSYGFLPNTSLRVGLEPGVTYTVSGYFQRVTFQWGNKGGCDELHCMYQEAPPDKEYTASPVATATTTWGGIKALYRALQHE